MSDDSNVVVQFKAIIQDYLDKLGSAASGTQQATQKINEHIEGVGKGFEKLMGTLGVIGGILAGGAMFKEAINATVEWTGEVMKLSRMLGITTEEASGLAVALHHLGIPAEDFTGAVTKMTRQMRQNEQAFDTLGIKTKTTSGEWRNANDVMLDAVAKLNAMQAGTDRNVAAQALFGARLSDLGPLLRLTRDGIEEGRIEAEKYHLVVGPDGAAKVRTYKESMRDLELIGTSLKVQLGNELVPVLTQLGKWFGEIGPGLAMVFSNVLKGITTAFYTLKFVIETVINYVQDFFLKAVEGFQGVGAVVNRVLHGDLEGAVSAYKQTNDRINQIGEDTALVQKQLWEGLGQDMEKIWDSKQAQSKAPSGDTLGGDDLTKQKGKDDTFQKWEKQLAIAKAAYAQENNMRDMDKDAEIAFWLQMAQTAGAGAENKAKAILKAQALIDAENKRFAAEEKKAAAERRQMDEEEARFKVESAKLDLNEKKQKLSEMAALGRISKEDELKQLKELRKQEAEIDKEALQEQLKNMELTALERKKINDKILIEDKKLGQDIASLDRQITQNRVAEWQKMATTLASSFGTAVRGIINHTMTLNQALASMAKEALMKLAEYAIKSIATSGAKGGAAAAASAAEDGPTGWMMALPVGLSVMAAILGLQSSVASAAGGFDIPSGMNPMTQLHEREMVLPAEHADTIRGLKNAPQTQPPPIQLKGVSAGEFFIATRSDLMKALSGARRDFMSGRM